MIQTIAFYLFAALVIASAVMVIMSRNPVHSVLWLILAFFNAAGLMVLVGAEFIAALMVIVYVGAVAVLFLFGLMLTRAPIGREALDSQNRVMGAVIAGIMFAVLVTLIIEAYGNAPAVEMTGPNVADIGVAIFANWVFPFEVLSMLLLGALIGAVLLSRRESGESGEETPVTRIQMADQSDEDAQADLVALAAKNQGGDE